METIATAAATPLCRRPAPGGALPGYSTLHVVELLIRNGTVSSATTLDRQDSSSAHFPRTPVHRLLARTKVWTAVLVIRS